VSRKTEWTTEDLDIAEDAIALEAQDHFMTFRRLMHPGMKWGWWVERITIALQRFYEDLVAGKRPKLAVMAPPQHGKSSAAEDFVAWVAGKNPDLNIIFASYSDELGIRTNLKLQRMMQSEPYRRVFPGTRVGVHGWTCNANLIEYAGHAGSFRNTTVEGAVNGLKSHLGVIDDPIKGRAEASSKTVRDRTWNWFADDFSTRFAADSGLLMIMTRWHIDDPLGRLLERELGVRVVSYPALAEKPERYRKPGDALFPELKPLEFLLGQKRVMSTASWESEYQQHPYQVGGGAIPIEKLKVIPIFDRTKIRRSVLSVDKAGTEGGGAHTAFVLMHDMGSDAVPRWIIEEIARGQWGALEREQRLRQAAETIRASFKPRYVDFKVVVEVEPGSGGKESAETTARNLSGFSVILNKVTGSKEVRAEPFVAASVIKGDVSVTMRV
jgi:phage terminase large subunit-like protein